MIAEKTISRPYQSDLDFWRVRDLLLITYPLTPAGFNWDIRRWEGWRFHSTKLVQDNELADRIHLWETAQGDLVGVVHPDGDGEMVLELHPDNRDLEAEMIGWGEQHLSRDDTHKSQIDTFVYDYDTPRQRLLQQRGYERLTYGSVTRRLRFGKKTFPQVTLAEPYTYILRTTRPDDSQRIADLLNAAFNRSFHKGQDVHNFMTLSPSFRHDLNLVVEAPDGSFASHVGVTYDAANRRGIFEPVCTHPAHQRKGLARMLMIEGMHRLKALGAADAYVDTGDGMVSNDLYEAVGFTEAYHGYIWRKALP